MKKNEIVIKIIGTETTYIGQEKRLGGHGARMLIASILRYAASPDLRDSRYAYITDNRLLAVHFGGVRPGDVVLVHVWNEHENRWGFVSEEVGDIRSLECFKHLGR